jgi:asparagine synthase (glutamine-hydrolysing)
MFAFALVGQPQAPLLIARDRFGEKPLYWGVFDNTCSFASEPKVLLAHPSSNRPQTSRRSLLLIIRTHVPAPLSIYEGINKLPAGATTHTRGWVA